jgi:hypothetical protein
VRVGGDVTLGQCTRGPGCIICQSIAAAESVGRLPALCHHFADQADGGLGVRDERDEALAEVSRLEDIVEAQNRRLRAAQRKGLEV